MDKITDQNKKSAQWTFEEGIRIGWGIAEAHAPMHEPMYFLSASGKAGDNESELYRFRRSRAYLEYLASLGCTQVWFNWWKGCGIEHERECMQQVAALFPICRELKLRAICYVSLGSLTLDTLLLEEPAAKDWITITQTGAWSSCQVTHQCFRCRPCFSSDGYLSYMEKMLGECLDAGADGIHFDNIGMQSEPDACHCERCTKKFREYLQQKYGGKLGQELFGMSDFTHATVPWFNQHNTANTLKQATIPMQRAWIDFKCKVYADAANRLIDFIRSRKKNAFVEMNLMEADGFSPAFWRAVDYALLMPKLEMICDERNNQEGLNKRGAIVGAYRARKWARAFGCAHNSGIKPRQLAGQISDDLAFSNAPQSFWNQYNQYQLKSNSLAEVAVLREQFSLRYNRFEPLEETLAFEQYLIERRIPFDMVSNKHLDNLDSRYKVLVLAGVEIMSDAMRNIILKWVSNGGKLLLTGNTGMYDEHYRLRRHAIPNIETLDQYRQALKPCNAFCEAIGEDPHTAGNDCFVRNLGKGSVGWIKTMDVDRLPRTPDNWTIPHDMLMLPRNANQIDEVFARLIPEGLQLKVEGEGRLYVHLSERLDTNEQMVHLINHAYPEQKAELKIFLKINRKVKEVVSFSVDDKDNNYALRKEAFEQKGDQLFIKVKEIQNHRTVIVR